MDKSNKFVDHQGGMFLPPVQKTRMETLRSFLYDKEEGSCLGRTPSSWAKIMTFYIIFYSCLACFFAICIWGLMQSIDREIPTYLLDSSIIGSSPGLASRPVSPEGRESVLIYNRTTKTWVSSHDWLPSVDKFLEEYQTNISNAQKCQYGTKRDNENVVCEVNTKDWKGCEPTGTNLSNICMFFKINKVFEWKPSFYEDLGSLPNHMPDSLKAEISNAITNSSSSIQKVWLSCVGRHEKDQENLGEIVYFPEQGFPAYYYPFRNQDGFKSPVVAVQIVKPKIGVEIDLECRAWARNIYQDRKEQLGVLNYKIKFE